MSKRQATTIGERLPRRLKCFVAMAFGEAETDRLYDRVIEPTLDAVNLHAIRVDRIEHNDDIDKRIIQELSDPDCRLVVADLTFARQSVYFEAGYAAREVPVIYTCRKDHFDKGAPDDRRVHFDLQMKNIIKWSEPDDPKFKLRLTKRLNHVLRPILQAERRAMEHDAQEAQFRALSVNQQRDAMKQLLQVEFTRAKFRPFDIRPYDHDYLTPPDEDELRATARYGFKRQGASLNLVEGLVPHGNALKALSKAATYENALLREWFDANKGKKQVYFSRQLFVCTPDNVSRKSFVRTFSSFGLDSERDCFIGMSSGRSHSRGRLPISIHFLDGVRSLDDLRGQIRRRLGKIELQ